MIPYFAPVVLRLGSLQVSLFGVLVAIATLAGMGQLIRRGTQLGQRTSKSASMATYSLCWAIAVAHLVEILAYHPERLMQEDLRLVFAILVSPTAGISSVGGFLGGTIGMLVWSWRHGVPFLIQVDSMLFAFPAAWMFARLGCFSAHDHPGTLTDSLLGVDYGTGPLGGVRHDLGLYEVLWALGMTILFQWLSRRPRPLGLYAALATVLYSPVRFLLDFLRVGDRRYLGLTPAQYVMVLMLGLGVVLLWQIQARPRASTTETP
jgi:phosphatidylglycerol:prolipoprotein diacylglycerol transferase